MSDDKLKKIRSGRWQRASSLAKMTVRSAVQYGWHGLSQSLSDSQTRQEAWKKLLLDQARLFASEVTKMKGSLLKAGQMLSIYADRLLPPEAAALLKSLQSNSVALEWEQIEKVLLAELGGAYPSKLEVEHEPIGAASLGQVHRAVVRESGAQIALKVRYPGVEKVVDSDLNWLRTLLGMSSLIPFAPALDTIFAEARRMLHQEMDYQKEAELTDEYRERLSAPGEYVVPRVWREYSSASVLATSFEPGLAIEDERVALLPQPRRDRLGKLFFELYLKEVFVLRLIQPDPHFGNYRIRLDPDGWVLYDFGAARELSPEFCENYRKLLRACVFGGEEDIRRELRNMGFTHADSSPTYEQQIVDFCLLVSEPARSPTPYDWGASDLPERAVRYLPKFALSGETRLPPIEMLSLDRKVGGTFLVLSKLKARFDVRALVAPYLV